MKTGAITLPLPAFLKNGRSSLGGFRQIVSLVLIIIIAIILSPRQHGTGENIFLSGENLSDIFRQVSENGIIAVGMTFVILTRGIDLSVGSMLALAATLVAKLLTGWQSAPGPFWHMTTAVAATLLITTLIGTGMGATIARFRIQPFIVTLAGMIGLRGLARFLTDNANIDFGFGSDVSATFATTLSAKPVVIGTFVLLAVAFAILLRFTVFGLKVKSIGDNPTAARYAGLPVARTLVTVYAISGFLTGVAGVLHAAQNYQGNPNDGVAYELDAIAAVVIGGASMSGGQGSIAGTITGSAILGILTNMFRLKGVDINVEMMCKALIIVIAVFLQTPRAARS